MLNEPENTGYNEELQQPLLNQLQERVLPELERINNRFLGTQLPFEGSLLSLALGMQALQYLLSLLVLGVPVILVPLSSLLAFGLFWVFIVALLAICVFYFLFGRLQRFFEEKAFVAWVGLGLCELVLIAFLGSFFLFGTAMRFCAVLSAGFLGVTLYKVLVPEEFEVGKGRQLMLSVFLGCFLCFLVVDHPDQSILSFFPTLWATLYSCYSLSDFKEFSEDRTANFKNACFVQVCMFKTKVNFTAKAASVLFTSSRE